jgi:hypothetical protein
MADSYPKKPQSPERAAALAKIIPGIPALRRDLFDRVAHEAAPPRAAIKAKCQECVGYEDVTESIRSCRVHRCALWAYRPYQADEPEADTLE